MTMAVDTSISSASTSTSSRSSSNNNNSSRWRRGIDGYQGLLSKKEQKPVLLEKIASTRDTLCIAVFCFTDIDVARMILTLLEQWTTVRVQILVHPDHASSEKSVLHVLSQHERVTVMTSAELHSKEVIVDGAWYFTGSTNISNKGLTVNGETMHLFEPGTPFFEAIVRWTSRWARSRYLTNLDKQRDQLKRQGLRSRSQCASCTAGSSFMGQVALLMDERMNNRGESVPTQSRTSTQARARTQTVMLTSLARGSKTRSRTCSVHGCARSVRARVP